MKSTLFRAAVIVAASFLSSTGAWAQSGGEKKDPAGQQQGQDGKMRRLESVTWNSVEHRLTWIISDGEKVEGAYRPAVKKEYRIDMDKALMLFNGERRRFSEEEATSVHALLDVVAKYAVESTLWWDAGQGDKLEDGRGRRAIAESIAGENVLVAWALTR